MSNERRFLEGLVQQLEEREAAARPVPAATPVGEHRRLAVGMATLAIEAPVSAASSSDEANADVVCCLDSHVLLAPGALAAILAWFDEHPDSCDPIQGPSSATPSTAQLQRTSTRIGGRHVRALGGRSTNRQWIAGKEVVWPPRVCGSARMAAERDSISVRRWMSSKLLRMTVGGSVALVGLFVCGFGVLRAQPRVGMVHLRGTAYEFNNVHTVLGGATIRVSEFPKLRATVQPDGRYDLQVPDRARVTPYIVDPGYHTIYLQTFRTSGENLANVNFQTPTDAVYRALVSLLKVPVDSGGNLLACAIVSTFSTRNVRDLSFAHFIAYGAHGVAGATATATPALPRPVYFNESVVPDPAQTASSKDGGVVWTGVPAGVYTISAHDPVTRFASFVATCRPGRVVNASPPWGLHELALPNPARILARWSVTGAQTQVTSLSALRLPAGAIVRVSCTGRTCLFGARTFRARTNRLDIRRLIGSRNLRLSVGDTLQVTVMAHAVNGLVVRWRAVNGHVPIRTTLCVPLGDAAPQSRCPTA